MSSSDVYWTYDLVEFPFAISMQRSVSAVASTGIQLFLATVMGIDLDDDGNYKMSVLTLSADYLSFASEGVMVDSPMSVSGITINETTSGCFVNHAFVCGQIFEVTMPFDVDCTAIDDGEVIPIDFSGEYEMAFNPECRELDDGEPGAQCTAFFEDQGTEPVAVGFEWEFVDQRCVDSGVNLFDTDFAVDLSFYGNDSFAVPVAADYLFDIERDEIYGEAVVSIEAADDSVLFDVVTVSVENVFVCTSDYSDLMATLDSSSGVGGCLSSYVDDDGAYLVVGSGADPIYNGMVYDAPTARFSFTAFGM